MIDGVKIEVPYLNEETWFNNALLDFPMQVSRKTGEILPKTTLSEYKGLKFVVTPSRSDQYEYRKFIRGSLHKYFNDGKHNYNLFTYQDFLTVVKDLQAKFNIEPERAFLRNLEFGVNLTLPFTVKEFLRRVIGFPDKKFSELKEVKEGKRFTGKSCKRNDYEVKLYDKGEQNDVKETDGQSHLLRFEIKVKKMRFLAKFGIRTLADLTKPQSFEVLGAILKNVFNDLLIYDWDINENDLPKRDLIFLLKHTNPNFWENLSHKGRYKHKEKFYAFLAKYSEQQTFKLLNIAIDKQLFEIFNFNSESYSGETLNGTPFLYLPKRRATKNDLPVFAFAIYKPSINYQNQNSMKKTPKGTFSPLKYTVKSSPDDQPTKSNLAVGEYEPLLKGRKRRKRYVKTCVVCGRVFESSRIEAKYCSGACKVKAQTERLKAKRAKQREKEESILKTLKGGLNSISKLEILRRDGDKEVWESVRAKDLRKSRLRLRSVRRVRVLQGKQMLELSSTRAKELLKSIAEANKPKQYKRCLYCGKPLTGKQVKFCSVSCAKNYRKLQKVKSKQIESQNLEKALEVLKLSDVRVSIIQLTGERKIRRVLSKEELSQSRVNLSKVYKVNVLYGQSKRISLTNGSAKAFLKQVKSGLMLNERTPKQAFNLSQVNSGYQFI